MSEGVEKACLRILPASGPPEDVAVESLDPGMRRRAAIHAQKLSLKTTEAFYETSPTAGRLAYLLQEYFGDKNAVYALKKALICDIEGRLEWLLVAGLLAEERGARVALPTAFALDHFLVGELARRGVALSAVELPPPTRPVAARIVRRAWRALKRVGMLLLRPVPGGLTPFGPAQRSHYRVAKLNKHGPGIRGPIRSDLFLADGKRILLGDILVILSKVYVPSLGSPDRYERLGVSCTDTDGWSMPVWHLLREVLPRFLRFNALLCLDPETSPADAYLKDVATMLVGSSLPWEAFMQHYRVDCLIDDEEFSPLHIVKTMILNRYGGRTLRLPHSMIDTPGSLLSYLHYDVFASPSEYPRLDYSSSWSAHTACVPVGQMFNDSLSDPRLQSGSEKAKTLLERLRTEGKQVLVVLTDSTFWWADNATGLPRQHDSFRIIRIALDIARERDDLVVLVKPKGGKVSFLKHPPYSDVLAPARDAGKAYVLTPEDGYGATDDYAVALQFVLPYATVCLCMSGSAVYESLAAGVPVFALPYSPSHRTSLTERLREIVVFNDEGRLRQEIEQVLDSGKWSPPEEIVNLVDPFRDGRAIERLRAIVLGAAGDGGRRGS